MFRPISFQTMGQQKGFALERYRHFFIALLIVIFLSFTFILIALMKIFSDRLFDGDRYKPERINLEDVNNAPLTTIKTSSPLAASRNYRCTYYDCFNAYRCGRKGHDRLSVYIYPLRKYVDENDSLVSPQMSREYYGILKAIRNSNYYTANHEEACLLIPSIDTLNQNRVRLKEISQALGQLPL